MLFNLVVYGAILLTVDLIYISFVTEHFKKLIKLVQGSKMKVNLAAAAICYLFLILGGFYFSIYKRLSFIESFIFGMIIYGVYAFTNLALFEKWNLTTQFLIQSWFYASNITLDTYFNYFSEFWRAKRGQFSNFSISSLRSHI